MHFFQQRRVSFAEPLIESGLQLEAVLPQPALVAPETTGNEKVCPPKKC